MRISFLIAGHTKFSPDLVFAKIAKSYNRNNVFNTEELKGIIGLHADVVIDHGEIVSDWRTKLTKYSKLPGIRNLHDFVFAKNPISDSILCKTRQLCYRGGFENGTIHLSPGRDAHENVAWNRHCGNSLTTFVININFLHKIGYLYQLMIIITHIYLQWMYYVVILLVK